VPINLPTFSELPAQLPAQKPVRTAPTQTSLIRCSKLIPNRRRGGLPTPRAQFINNGFGLGEFLGKRGLNGRHCLPRSNWATYRDGGENLDKEYAIYIFFLIPQTNLLERH
jgi:hypothetical protein